MKFETSDCPVLELRHVYCLMVLRSVPCQEEFGKAVEPSPSEDLLAEVLAPCISEALACDDETTAQVLEENLHWREGLDEQEDLLHILQSAEIKDQFSKDDAQMVEQALKESESRNRERQGLFKKIRTLRKKGSAGPGVAAKRKPVNFEPDKAYTSAQVDAFMPAQYRSYKDIFNGCWRIFARKGKFNVSRSWGPEGCESTCVHKLGTIVWARHCELHPDAACPWVFNSQDTRPKNAEAEPKAKVPKAAASASSAKP